MSHASIVPAAVETRVIVHRADGTEIDLGVIAAQYADPEQQAEWERGGRPAAAARIDAANAALRDTQEG